MNTYTLTFPTVFLRPASQSERGQRSRTVGGPGLLGLLSGRRTSISGRASRSYREERRIRRSARRGRRILLGTFEQPYEPGVLGGAALRALKEFDDLEITITTRATEILEEVALLADLDRHHAVAVDVLVAALGGDSSDLEERLRTVAGLAEQGLTTRLVVTDLPSRSPGGGQMGHSPGGGQVGHSPGGGQMGHSPSARAEGRLRPLFASAKSCGAFDVAAAHPSRGDETAGWRSLFRRLRLEHGFPSPLPGRG